MMAVRRGPVIAATWLIGLGLVFLVRQALQLDWSEAWPLFLILLGVADIVSRLVGGVRTRGVAAIWSFTWPVVLIAAGIVLLLSATGNLGQGPIDLIANAWPWVLVGLGLWFLLGALIPSGASPLEQLTVPLAGAGEARVRIRFGAGELSIGPAVPGNLVEGRFTGGVLQRATGAGRIELEQDTTYGLPWLDNRSDWNVGVTGEVPLDLRLDTGAARARLDLTELRLRTLELHTGASDTRVRLPRAAGATTVTAETGAAALVVEVPRGVAARIRSRMAIGSSQVDEQSFPRTSTGHESADYATAANRVDLDLQGGVGSIRVVAVD
jgi:hypothetical protein